MVDFARIVYSITTFQLLRQLKRIQVNAGLMFFAYMPLLKGATLLFGLNLLDAILTLIWVKNGVATEGNRLMASLLDIGDSSFLATKIAIGTITAIVLIRWGDMKLARLGLSIALGLYLALMGIHALTGLWAAGLISRNLADDILLLFT